MGTVTYCPQGIEKECVILIDGTRIYRKIPYLHRDKKYSYGMTRYNYQQIYVRRKVISDNGFKRTHVMEWEQY